MKIAIASGKGGVGKSMLSSSLAILFSQEKKIIAVDTDVDAPNLALWLGEKKKPDEEKKISTTSKPTIDYEKCRGTGKCAKSCNFGALKMKKDKPEHNYFLCEGCGVCEIVCPQGAIRLKKVKNAAVKIIEKTKFGFPLVWGQLFPGESSSGKVVSEIKEEAEQFATKNSIMIIDTPPGTGCPVNAALRDVDLIILITEPTPSGLSDLKRILSVVSHFGLDYFLVINKWDINPDYSQKIEKEFRRKILGRISYDQKIFKVLSKLKPIMETELRAKKEIKNIFKKIKNYV